MALCLFGSLHVPGCYSAQALSLQFLLWLSNCCKTSSHAVKSHAPQKISNHALWRFCTKWHPCSVRISPTHSLRDGHRCYSGPVVLITGNYAVNKLQLHSGARIASVLSQLRMKHRVAQRRRRLFGLSPLPCPPRTPSCSRPLPHSPFVPSYPTPSITETSAFEGIPMACLQLATPG